MPKAIVTGSGGLIGSQAVRAFIALGYDVIGVENDMRARFFGKEASTQESTDALTSLDGFQWVEVDIRDRGAIEFLFRNNKIDLIIHTAAQPSHDWAASDPHTDFTVNANGTLNLLQCAREHAIDAPFIFCSTSKVYGDLPNSLPLLERESRWDLPKDHRYYEGIDTTMSIDQSTHSLFGVSKISADLLVQEYGRYFDMPTVCFRGGCLSGPNHAGTMLHGFLAYLMKCTMTGAPYKVFGYKAKQVRCNIHSADLVRAFDAFRRAPRSGVVYNIGGGRKSNCSMVEAMKLCQEIADRELDWELLPTPRIGDHIWWISNIADFQRDYPDWELQHDVESILRAMYEHNRERWI